MAYDPVRRRVVLFGGKTEDDRSRDDTWEWDGSAWTEVVGLNRPPRPRENHAMTFDTNRRRVILFGGQGSGGVLGDTWEWDGTNWSLSAS